MGLAILLTTMAKMSPGVRHKKAGRFKCNPHIKVSIRDKIKMAGLACGLGSSTATWGNIRGWSAITVVYRELATFNPSSKLLY
jgi:hypothetical protein